MQTKTLILLGCAALLLLAIALLVPNLLPPKTVSSRNACVANLEFIQRTKSDWAKRNGKGPSATPTESDLFGTDFSRTMPLCPAQGSYTIGKVGELPECSIP